MLDPKYGIIFEVNKIYHPGEKRLVEIVKKRCNIIPVAFQENIEKLLRIEDVEETLDKMYNNLKTIIE